MDMGTGKSFVQINDVAELFESGKINGFAVLCPKGAYQLWVEEQIPEHLPPRIKRRVVQWKASPGKGLLAQIEDLCIPQKGVLDIFSMNVEAVLGKLPVDLMTKFIRSHEALMAVDESTCIGGHAAKRTKAIVKMGAEQAKYRRILTGDAAPDSPLSLWSQAQFLEKGLLGHSFVAFRSEHCHLKKLYMGQRTVEVLDKERGTDGFKNLDRLRERISAWSFIVKKEDCLDLPPKVYLTRNVEMNDAQRAAYESMRDMAIVDLENKLGLLAQGKQPHVDNWDELSEIQGDLADENVVLDKAKLSTASLVLTQMLRLHQIACGFIKTDAGTEEGFPGPNYRLDALLDLLEECSGSLLVWSPYRYNIAQLTEAIGKKFGKDSVRPYFGDTTLDERQAFKEDFQAGKFPYGVLNQDTGGQGITLTKARTAIYYGNKWAQRLRSQSESRIDRIGATGACSTFVDLICPGTVDEKIIASLKARKSLSAMISPSNWKEFLK